MNWPFDRWQRIAVQRFGLAPQAFWDMPVRDWLVLLEGARRPGFDQTALNELLNLHPDQGDDHDPQ